MIDFFYSIFSRQLSNNTTPYTKPLNLELATGQKLFHIYTSLSCSPVGRTSPHCLLKYPPAVISKWKSRLHGRSFGSDRYSEYFPQPGFFHIVAFTPFSTTMCGIYYHIGLQNTTHKEYFVQNIHEITFIFFRISISRKSKKRIIWKEYLRRIVAQFLIRKRFMMMTSLNLLKLRGENLWTCNISEFKLHSQCQFYCCDFWGVNILSWPTSTPSVLLAAYCRQIDPLNLGYCEYLR